MHSNTVNTTKGQKGQKKQKYVRECKQPTELLSADDRILRLQNCPEQC